MTSNNDKGSKQEDQVYLIDEPDFLRDLVRQVLQDILEHEIREQLRADHYERTPERTGYRNGYKPRKLKTRVGTIELEVPQDREGNFKTEVFARYQRSEKALLITLMEMYLNGVSTRKVKEITEQLCGISFSKSMVSSLTKDLDETLENWRNRELEVDYPYVYIDARYEKVRENKKVMDKAVLIIAGVSEDGYREVLSVELANSESEQSWSEVFKRLKERGLRGVELVISDEHSGMLKAIRRHFQGVAWQHCQVHFLRNCMSMVPRKARKEVVMDLKELYNSRDMDNALKKLQELIFKYEEIYPKLASKLELEGEETLMCFNFPQEHIRRIKSTNCLERLSQEIKRRTRVVRIFPNEASCLRLSTAIAMEKSEEWLTGKKYLDMELLDVYSSEQRDEAEEKGGDKRTESVESLV